MNIPVKTLACAHRFFSPLPGIARPLGRKVLPVFQVLLVSAAICVGFAQPAFAGAESTQTHELTFNISDSGGQSVANQDLSGIVSYDPNTGVLTTPPIGTPLGGNWSWSTVDFTDSTKSLATPVMSWHSSTQTNGAWDSIVQLKATGNVDPFMSYSFSAKNNTTAVQNFTFSYGESIVPPVTGNYSLYSDIAGSLTHGGISPVAQLSPLLPDFDGDGLIEIQTLKLSTNGGLTFLNAGVDLGGAQSRVATGTTIFGPVSGTVTGNLSSIDYWQFDVAFTLTPGKDAAALSGYAEISAIPEPATYAGVMGAMILCGVALRRRFQVSV